MSDTEKESYLFENLDKTYLEERKKFDEARVSENNRRLFGRVRKIVDAVTADASLQNAGVITETDVTLAVADLMYDDLIKPGESAVVRATNWIPGSQREVNGTRLDFSVRFGTIDFVKLAGQEPQRRLGPVRIEGKLTDQDGVSADFPLASIQENPKSHQFQLLWNFGNEIPFGSEDYTEVTRIIDSAEKQLEIV